MSREVHGMLPQEKFSGLGNAICSILSSLSEVIKRITEVITLIYRVTTTLRAELLDILARRGKERRLCQNRAFTYLSMRDGCHLVPMFISKFPDANNILSR